jgi:hypothetical protein
MKDITMYVFENFEDQPAKTVSRIIRESESDCEKAFADLYDSDQYASSYTAIADSALAPEAGVSFCIQQWVSYGTSGQFEDITNGESQTADEAIAGMRELEQEQGWRNLRVVRNRGPRYNLSGNRVLGSAAVDVIEEGLKSE